MTESAWGSYFSAFAGNIDARWARAEGAYRTLKAVRTELGLPFYGTAPGAEGPTDSNGWSAGLDQDAVNIREMARIAAAAFRDAADGKRQVALNGDDPVIERLAGDKLAIALTENGVPVLVGDSGGSVNVPGTISRTGVGAVIWGLAFAAGAIVTVAQAYAVVRACDLLEALAEQKTMQTLAAKQVEAISKGATPAEAKQLTDAILKGTTELQKAKTETALAKGSAANPDRWSGLVKSVGWVGGLLLVGYVVVKMMPSAPARTARA